MIPYLLTQSEIWMGKFDWVDNSGSEQRMSTFDDPVFLNVAFDVVVRFKAHDSYKGEKGALKALARRAPGFSPEQCRELFDLMCKVYDRARELASGYLYHPGASPGKFADPADIDHEACMRELDRIEPGVAMPAKRALLGWAIFWYYLK